jgi:hypothetical protein
MEKIEARNSSITNAELRYLQEEIDAQADLAEERGEEPDRFNIRDFLLKEGFIYGNDGSMFFYEKIKIKRKKK